MNILGQVRNGVVVLEGGTVLPEGSMVIVILSGKPRIRTAKNPKRVEFPLVRSSSPGSVHLTNEKIAQLLDEEDVSS